MSGRCSPNIPNVMSRHGMPRVPAQVAPAPLARHVWRHGTRPKREHDEKLNKTLCRCACIFHPCEVNKLTAVTTVPTALESLDRLLALPLPSTDLCPYPLGGTGSGLHGPPERGAAITHATSVRSRGSASWPILVLGLPPSTLRADGACALGQPPRPPDLQV